MSEKEIIKDCIEGDRSAQNALYDLFAGKMFAVCLRYSRTREEAEDTFQEAFMKVYEKIKTYRNDGSFEGWIRRIVVNTAIEKFRKNLNRGVLINIDDLNYTNSCSANLVSDDILHNLEAHELMQLVQQLPSYCRIVFNLYVFEGLKHKEIAKELGISEGTSKSHLSDARSILKKTLIKINKPALKLTYYG